MVWSSGPVYGGESRDAAAENITNIRTSDVAIDTTAARLQPHVDASAAGSRCQKFLTNTNASKAIIPAFGAISQSVSGRMLAFSGAVGLSALPSADIGLISNTTQGGARYVRIGTDGTFRFHDNAGNEIGPRSRTVVSTTGITEFTIFYDFISFTGSSLNRAIVRLYIGEKEELMFLATQSGADVFMESSTDTITFGEWLPAATNRGADFFLDDAIARYSTDIHDSPHLTPYPRIRNVGAASRPATAEGGTSDWGSTTAGPNSWQDVDEFPNDGATSTIGITTAVKHLFTCSAANPLTSAMTVHEVGIRIVANITGAGKLFCEILLRDASSNESQAAMVTPGTTFVGVAPTLRLTRPAGGAWVWDDFKLTAGVSDLQFGAIAIASGAPNISNITSPYLAVSTHSLEAGRYPGAGGAVLMNPAVL